MHAYRLLMILSLFCGLPFLIGWKDAPESPKSKPPGEERHPPVLKADDDAKTIIAKAVKTYGGAKAFSRWNCGYLKYKTKGGILPVPFAEVTVEDTFQLPGHFKRVTRVDTRGKELVMVVVVNDGKGWKKRGDEEAEAIENGFTSRAEHPFAGFCNLSPLTEATVQLTKASSAKIDGRQTIGVQAKSEKLGEVDFYFELETGLLLKSRKSLPGGDSDQPSVLETFLDNYKEVQGGKVPMHIKGLRDGKVILDVTLMEAKFAERFPERTFAKP